VSWSRLRRRNAGLAPADAIDEVEDGRTVDEAAEVLGEEHRARVVVARIKR
jgi:hypothetical protein